MKMPAPPLTPIQVLTIGAVSKKSHFWWLLNPGEPWAAAPPHDRHGTYGIRLPSTN